MQNRNGKNSAIARKLEALVEKNFRPAQEVAILLRRDGVEYWVKGYEIFDPEMCHSTRNGYAPLKVKPARHGHILVTKRGQQGKPINVKETEVIPVKSGKHYHTFAEVFGTGTTGGSIVLNVELAEKEDLSLGVTFGGEEDE